MKLDPAVLDALKLIPEKTTVAAHGGSGFSETAKITTTLEDGSKRHYFMKTGSGKDKAVMFEGEHASLNAIHDAVPSLAPASLAFGELEKSGSYFLVTEFLDLGARSSSGEKGSGMEIAEKLAKLHTTPAPIPPGYTQPVFGFPVPTCCGDTPQTNPYTPSWATFFATHRLHSILSRTEQTQGPDPSLRQAIERTASLVVPALLRDGHLGGEQGIQPVVVHGDLWSGNKSRGRIGGAGGVEELVFDPSACYAHSEYELGIMRMFGGFEGGFWERYHELVPRAEPVGEYEDRVRLYELYHHLNHNAIFGGAYRGGAMGIMSGLLEKYGNGG